MLTTPVIHIDPSLRRRVSPRVLVGLGQRARRAGRALAIDPSRWATLGLRIVDDAEMALLHQRYMNESGPTDVLSFGPQLDTDTDANDLSDPLAHMSLGDIVLDWDAIVRQARGWTHAARLDEATVLLVHGLAHLLGHDHRNRSEGRLMARAEAKVLRHLKVPDQPRPYAPRLLSPGPSKGAKTR